jgi:hypothetical protein
MFKGSFQINKLRLDKTKGKNAKFKEKYFKARRTLENFADSSKMIGKLIKFQTKNVGSVLIYV